MSWFVVCLFAWLLLFVGWGVGVEGGGGEISRRYHSMTTTLCICNERLRHTHTHTHTYTHKHRHTQTHTHTHTHTHTIALGILDFRTVAICCRALFPIYSLPPSLPPSAAPRTSPPPTHKKSLQLASRFCQATWRERCQSHMHGPGCRHLVLWASHWLVY